MKQELRSYEWLIIFIFSILIFLITSIAYFNQPTPVEPQHITITLKGAASPPQIFSVPQGTSLADILAQAHLPKSADLAKIKKDRILTKDETIHIPSNILKVTIEGAIVNPGVYQLPLGTRIQDLQQHITPLAGADAAFFKKKRKLKDQETVTVPFKKAKTSSPSSSQSVRSSHSQKHP